VRRTLRLVSGLGTGRAFFPSLLTGISHVPFGLFSFETERRGRKDSHTRDPSGLYLSKSLMTPARYFSEALIALARPLAFICVVCIIALAARLSHIGLGSGPRVMH
jgi:hypothetical protein